jgi:hypothetical protein
MLEGIPHMLTITVSMPASTVLHVRFIWDWLIPHPRSRTDCILRCRLYLSKKKLHGLSPRANYFELPPLVGEVIANFCGQRVPRGQRDGSLLPYSRFYRQEPLLSYQVVPQLYSRG